MRTKVAVVAVSALFWVGLATAAARPWPGHYTVRAGDSLSGIALHYGVSFRTLAEVNRLDWRKPLLVGVVLDVPGTGDRFDGWKGIYVVRSGDTLSGIALHFGVPLPRLASVNRLNVSGLLWVGTKLHIPGSGSPPLDLADVVQSDPYRKADVGYDASYPNCAGIIPLAHSFAMIGLNQGRPFTANPCFTEEWTAAAPPRSVYINTAYAATMARQITPECGAAGREQPLGRAAQRAFAIGCSEATAALQLLGTISPLAIWLDVEPANTWSAHQNLNVATLKGLLDHLLTRASHPPIGVYSNTSFWQSIVGGWTALSVPEWVATGAPDPPGCPAGFAAGPVWLSQSLAGTRDVDTVC